MFFSSRNYGYWVLTYYSQKSKTEQILFFLAVWYFLDNHKKHCLYTFHATAFFTVNQTRIKHIFISSFVTRAHGSWVLLSHQTFFTSIQGWKIRLQSETFHVIAQTQDYLFAVTPVNAVEFSYMRVAKQVLQVGRLVVWIMYVCKFLWPISRRLRAMTAWMEHTILYAPTTSDVGNWLCSGRGFVHYNLTLYTDNDALLSYHSKLATSGRGARKILKLEWDDLAA